MKFIQLAVTFALFSLGPLACGQQSKNVSLTRSGSTKISGAITGKSYMDYLIKVGAGQVASVSLTIKSSSVYFNVLPPGSNGVALFNGSMHENVMTKRSFPIAGAYKVRVYQMGAAADENKKNSFTISVTVQGTALKPIPSSKDAKLKGTPFHARSIVDCTVSNDKKRASCDAYIIRYGGGSATVEFRAGRLVRRVLFVKGIPKAHDSQESFTYSRSGEDTTIKFGDDPSEKYLVPDALIFGG